MTRADLIAIGIFWIGFSLAAGWYCCRQARWARRMEAELTDTNRTPPRAYDVARWSVRRKKDRMGPRRRRCLP